MRLHLPGRSYLVLLLFLFAPAAIVAYLSRSPRWLIIVPLVMVVLALLVAALPVKRKITPAQFADELERHLLGAGGAYDWDDTTSVAISDPQLEQLRRALPKFDSLKLEKDKDELKAIIEALRRGEIPMVFIPTERRH